MFSLVPLVLHLAALSLARAVVQARRTGWAELITLFWLFAAFAIVLPMQLANVCGMVSRGWVALFTLVASALMLFGSRLMVRRQRAEPVLLWAGLARRLRGLGFSAVMLLCFGGLWAYSLLQVAVLASDAWDGVWYHDTISGFVLQSGGGKPMPLPPNLLQQANGFPRSAELTSAFWWLFWGRSAIELPNTLAALPMFSAGYLLARRFAGRRVAVGLAVLAALIPGAMLQWRTTYVDVFAAAWGLTAMHFATPPHRDRFGALLLGAALGLAIGSKSMALLLGPGCVLAWYFGQPRRSWSELWIVALPALFLGLTLVPNYRDFHNPFWPIQISAPRLGIDWPGVRKSSEVSVNASARETLASVFVPPAPGRDFADIRWGGYGVVFAWAMLPLSLVAASLVALRVWRTSRVRDERIVKLARARAVRVLFVVVQLALPVLLSPALWSARYMLVQACALFAISGGLSRQRRWGRPMFTVVLVLGFGVTLARIASFTPSLGGASVKETLTALRNPQSSIALVGPASWTMDAEVARARDRELTTGTLVVFSDGVTFPALLYNDRCDNQLQYAAASSAWGPLLRKLRPTWIVASPGESLGLYAEAHPSEWEPIGAASRGMRTVAYRRRVP